MARELPSNDLIRERLGEDHPIPLGWTAIIETYSPGDNFKCPDGSDSVFVRPDTAIDRDQYHSCIGRILMLGASCFKGEKFKYWDVFPEVGDYVKVKKYTGILNTWDNQETGEQVNIQEIEDVLLRVIIPDPSRCSTHKFVGQ